MQPEIVFSPVPTKSYQGKGIMAEQGIKTVKAGGKIMDAEQEVAFYRSQIRTLIFLYRRWVKESDIPQILGADTLLQLQQQWQLDLEYNMRLYRAAQHKIRRIKGEANKASPAHELNAQDQAELYEFLEHRYGAPYAQEVMGHILKAKEMDRQINERKEQAKLLALLNIPKAA
ncbi:MAG: hypothetical protein AB7U41_04590 [Dongiaceae bacterium]